MGIQAISRLDAFYSRIFRIAAAIFGASALLGLGIYLGRTFFSVCA